MTQKSLSNLFRDYDVLGQYPAPNGPGTGMSYASAFALAYTFVKEHSIETLAVATDRRKASIKLRPAMVAGALTAGAKVMELGGYTGDYLTYAIGTLNTDGGIYMTGGTAPENYTGMRFIGHDAAPIPPDQIQSLAQRVATEVAPKRMENESDEQCVVMNLVPKFHDFLASILKEYGDIPPRGAGRFSVVVDGGDSFASNAFLNSITKLNLPDELEFIEASKVDGMPDNGYRAMDRIERMSYAVQFTKANLGLVWDGDGEGVQVVDEKGEHVPAAYIGAYLAAVCSQRWPGSTLVVDQRLVFPMMNTASMAKVGLYLGLPGGAPLRAAMRNTASVFGADCDGRYAFREMWWSESATIAAAILIHMVYVSSEPLSVTMKNMANLFPVDGPRFVPCLSPKEKLTAMLDSIRKTMGEDVLSDTTSDDGLVMRSKHGPDWRMVLTPEEHGVWLTAEGRHTVTATMLDSVVQGAIRDLSIGDKSPLLLQ